MCRSLSNLSHLLWLVPLWRGMIPWQWTQSPSCLSGWSRKRHPSIPHLGSPREGCSPLQKETQKIHENILSWWDVIIYMMIQKIIRLYFFIAVKIVQVVQPELFKWARHLGQPEQQWRITTWNSYNTSYPNLSSPQEGCFHLKEESKWLTADFQMIVFWNFYCWNGWSNRRC